MSYVVRYRCGGPDRWLALSRTVVDASADAEHWVDEEAEC